MQLRLLVISDLHCHHPSQGYADSLLLSDLAQKPENHNPVTALRSLVRKEGLKAEILLAPGDFTNKADKQGMQTAWQHIGTIGSMFGCESIAATLGNHDVIFKEQVPDAFALARGLLPDFPIEDQAMFDQFWSKGFYVQEGSHFRMLVINSVTNHTNDKSAKCGYVAPRHLSEINEYLNASEPKRFQIALCHHHPIQHEEINLGKDDLMENGSLLVELLSKHRFQLLVHGHKHHPRMRIDHSGGAPLTILASGSFAASLNGGLGTRARNVFHIVELNSHKPTVTIGSIKTWQFQLQKGWTPATYSAADFPHYAGFGTTKSAAELAAIVTNVLSEFPDPIVDWGVLVDRIPELANTPPNTLQALGEELGSDGYMLVPEPPDRPRVIGRCVS